MSEKMPKSSEQSLAGGGSVKNKIEHNENISIPIETNINITPENILKNITQNFRGAVDWEKNILWQVEKHAREQISKVLNEEYPEILPTALKIKENEEKLESMLGLRNWGYETQFQTENKIKSKSYNLKKAEEIYQENKELWEKIVGKDNYHGAADVIEQIRRLTKRDLEEKERIEKQEEEEKQKIKELLTKAGVESSKQENVPTHDIYILLPRYGSSAVCCQLGSYIRENNEKEIAKIVSVLYIEHPELKTAEAIILKGDMGPVVLRGPEMFYEKES